MSVRNLEYLFNAKSIAVIGASDRPHSVGATVFRNLIGGTFTGPIWPINSRRATVAGRRAFPSVGALPTPAELAVICTPAATVPQLVAELGAAGTKAAVVLTAGLSGVMTGDGRNLTDAMLAAARPHLLRVLGPNCFGMLVPGIGLNASFAHTDANVGDIAFVAQSGALMAAMLDWAKTHGIGFSRFISLGDAADVDCGDVLDYLASDPHTRAILLYLESVTAARKFMSAARAAARNKPVIAIKAGRVAEASKAAASHTGALAGADDVYDAAIRRAGMLRVATTLDLFDALEMLKHAKPLRGNRLAIITNGGGPGVMATDALIASNGKLAQLSDATIASLNAVLPTTWSHGNPVDIIGDAPPERYVAALKVLLDATEVDALLFIHAPTAIVASTEIADACAPVIRASPRNVLACWMGGDGVKAADAIFHSSGIPTYSTPEEAVRAFLQLTDYRRNQESLMQTPASVAEHFEPATVTARRTILDAIASGRSMLTEPEAKSVLTAYAIPVVETRVASNAANAVQAAIDLGFPVALKILSPDISHKSDVGGVMLNLQTADEVRSATEAMQSRCAKLRPDALLSGFTVQQMIMRGGAHELIVGCTTDAVFGPVILFGQGGTAVEAVADKAVALPPLNVPLARDLVAQTRIAKLLAGYRDCPPADVDAIHLTLIKISQLIADMPEIVELDINPLLADQHGVIALDARIQVQRTHSVGTQRFAIRPYPKELEDWIMFGGRRVLVRPIRPEDEPQHAAFLAQVKPEDMRLRFFHAVRELPHSALARFTQIDYDREMAFIAVGTTESGQPETLGVGRAIADPDNTCAEFAVLVRSELKGAGLGRALLERIIHYCRSRGTRELFGEVLPENRRMLGLATALGFRADASDNDCVRVSLKLASDPSELTLG